ncbi:hypothetical protein EPN44_12315 [bacterium]|nr:MAG: hypothetical protein EPN44_12315 [bacterium]
MLPPAWSPNRRRSQAHRREGSSRARQFGATRSMIERTFHEGEIDVQTCAGVRDKAARLGAHIRHDVPPIAAEFLAQRRFAVAGALDGAGGVWAMPLLGPRGFLSVVGGVAVRIDATPPSRARLVPAIGTNVGLLGIDFDTRRRMKVKGPLESRDGSLILRAQRVYSTCHKYIQRRSIDPSKEREEAPRVVAESGTLNRGQAAWIERADTFFVASYHPQIGADTQHRGGRPGFVAVSAGGSVISFPDYVGNNLFNTLGNLTADGRVGLLFLDFESGGILQVSGRGEVLWDAQSFAEIPGARRLVRVHVAQVVEAEKAIPLSWHLVEPSPFNP